MNSVRPLCFIYMYRLRDAINGRETSATIGSSKPYKTSEYIRERAMDLIYIELRCQG